MKLSTSILLLLLPFAVTSITYGQTRLDDFGRIIINTYLPENSQLPIEAKQALSTKLSQLTTHNGMGGTMSNPRFIITAHVNIGTKDIIAGPPQMIAQNLEITLFIGDAITNTLFASFTQSLKGVGTSENKAYIEAFKPINPRNKELSAFMDDAKSKIISYYYSQCDFLIKDAQMLVAQDKYDEAIYNLALVPEVCEDCYFKCVDVLAHIYQLKIDASCTSQLNEAKLIWASAQTLTGAEQVAALLTTIHPRATCQSEVNNFIRKIDEKLKADEKAKWQFQMRQYEDKVTAEKEAARVAAEQSVRDDQFRESQAERNHKLALAEVNAFRQVAVEYARNQPKSVTYNSISWW